MTDQVGNSWKSARGCGWCKGSVKAGTTDRCRLQKESDGCVKEKQQEGGEKEEQEAPAESMTELLCQKSSPCKSLL